MLFETMRDEVYERLGESDTDPDFWPQTFVDRQLNEAVKQFCLEERWRWLQTLQTGVTLAASSNTIDLPEDVDVNRTLALSLKPDADTDDSRLILPKRVSPTKALELRRAYPSEGAPAWFYVSKVVITGGEATDARTLQLRVVPTPDEAYDVEYIYFERATGAYTDGDHPPVPEDYAEAVIAWATAQCWLKELNGGGKAQEQFNLYNAKLALALKEHKAFGSDETVAWGAEEPQLHGMDRDIRRHLPSFLSGS